MQRFLSGIQSWSLRFSPPTFCLTYGPMQLWSVPEVSRKRPCLLQAMLLLTAELRDLCVTRSSAGAMAILLNFYSNLSCVFSFPLQESIFLCTHLMQRTGHRVNSPGYLGSLFGLLFPRTERAKMWECKNLLGGICMGKSVSLIFWPEKSSWQKWLLCQCPQIKLSHGALKTSWNSHNKTCVHIYPSFLTDSGYMTNSYFGNWL